MVHVHCLHKVIAGVGTGLMPVRTGWKGTALLLLLLLLFLTVYLLVYFKTGLTGMHRLACTHGDPTASDFWVLGLQI